MITRAVHSLIADDAAVQAVVGDRVYAVVAPQGVAMPFIVHQRITGVPSEVLSGSSGLVRSQFQVVIYGRAYDVIWDLADKVRLVMQGFSGDVDEFTIDHIHMIDQSDHPVDPFQADQAGVMGARLEFAVWHHEAVPVHEGT